jgi:uncharacterized membrane protein
MGCLALLLPIIIILPIVLVLVFFDVITISYARLGLSPASAIALLVMTLIGSVINIPISRRQIQVEQQRQPFFARYFYYIPPQVTTQTIAVNLGGAVIPIAFAIYLMPRSPLIPTIAATLAVIIVARLLSRPVPGVGILMPAWVPPLVSAGLAFLLARSNPAPVAYISGTVGTLIGADLLHWPNFKKMGSYMISIGGAGVFDGIFLAGILAVLIS